MLFLCCRVSKHGFSVICLSWPFLCHAGEKRCLNSELWHACAGPLVSLPAVGSRVVYFPQGHSEQADVETDEVYAQMTLQPLSPDFSQSPPAQELVARDLHGNEWKFRHIFRDHPGPPKSINRIKRMLLSSFYMILF
ncbi:unnamed protein product [Spirodela intermedia]|uniref:Uncharacterized protein n=1 Tax=Spirodela intermedia TaxID=51605 RepID=A0ABN7EEP7_SPIIN|nr:unnamed protein product [Spirodela intermedia]